MYFGQFEKKNGQDALDGGSWLILLNEKEVIILRTTAEAYTSFTTLMDTVDGHVQQRTITLYNAKTLKFKKEGRHLIRFPLNEYMRPLTERLTRDRRRKG